MSKRQLLIALAAGLTFSSISAAQWFGPWGNENDLATAWGLEPIPTEDPEEGPGETIDYSNSEPYFNMQVGSGSTQKKLDPPPVSTTAPRPAPPPVAAKKPLPRPPVATPRPQWNDPYRRMAPPRRAVAPMPVMPRGYGNYRPRPPAPYYAPRMPRLAPPAPMPPYPYYRRR